MMRVIKMIIKMEKKKKIFLVARHDLRVNSRD